MSNNDSEYSDETSFSKEVNEEEDEPILKIDLNRDFLGSLIQLFGDSSDEAHLESSLN